MLLASTLLWLANNLITRSIGGTLLELANATLNITTMIRMLRAAPVSAGSRRARWVFSTDRLAQ
jgi:hypothetical protein